jgi:hypothetical protein
MPLDDPTERILADLLDADIEFIVVGGLAAVLMGAPVVTFDSTSSITGRRRTSTASSPCSSDTARTTAST